MSITQRVYFLLVALTVAVEAKKILRAQEGVAITGNFIVKLSADTSSERFDDLVEHIEHEAGDGGVHAKVDGKFAKIITATLSETALEKVSCKNTGNTAFMYITCSSRMKTMWST